MNVFTVIEPGPFTTIQDIGRFHYRRFGIAAVGAMDSFSFRIGNILVGIKSKKIIRSATYKRPKGEVMMSWARLRSLNSRKS